MSADMSGSLAEPTAAALPLPPLPLPLRLRALPLAPPDESDADADADIDIGPMSMSPMSAPDTIDIERSFAFNRRLLALLRLLDDRSITVSGIRHESSPAKAGSRRA